jgi:translocation and assembly module TamB
VGPGSPEAVPDRVQTGGFHLSRSLRTLRSVTISIGVLVVLVLTATVATVRTDWFRNYVRDKIINATEDATGGRTEVGSFAFDWTHLRATIADFVIHGKEPAGSDPFLRAARVEVDLRLLSGFQRLWEIAYLGIDRPQANIIVLPDGSSNIPSPRVKSTSSKTPLQAVVDLAVGHFELKHGSLAVADQKLELNLRGSNLLAQLWFDSRKAGYRGQLAFQPVYVVSGRKMPVGLKISMPVAIGSNRIDFQNVSITTPNSNVSINGSLQNPSDPQISGRVSGQIALADLRDLANLPIDADGPHLPRTLRLDANAAASKKAIQIAGLRLEAGQSNVEASGTLKSTNGAGSLEFKSRLSLDELGRLAKLSVQLKGVLEANGTARLDGSDDYHVTGDIEAKDVSFRQGGQQIGGVSVHSTVSFDPHYLELKVLRVAAFGGELNGEASVENFAEYRFHGDLRGVDTRGLAQALADERIVYDGVVSGSVEATGDFKAPAMKSLAARARLSIAPGRQGVPLSGRFLADYSGATGDIRLKDSHLALPRTRITLDGSILRRLDVTLITRDLNELIQGTNSPVDLNKGEAKFTGAVTGGLVSPRIAGHLTASAFTIEGRAFDSVGGDLAASNTGVAVENGSLNRREMHAQFAGSVGLRNWKPAQDQRLSLQLNISNGDLADIAVLAGQNSHDFAGALNADLRADGTVGNPHGTANTVATNGELYGEPFDRMQARATLTDQLIAITAASVESGAARVNLTAEYQHPSNSYTAGRLHAHVQSNEFDLARIRNLQARRPNTAGVLRLDADVSGTLSQVRSDHEDRIEFLLTSVNGNGFARGLRYEGEQYGDINANARTNGQSVSYQLTSDFAGSSIHGSGTTQLVRNYPTTADASISNLSIERVLAAAGRTDVRAKGELSGMLHFAGSTDHPQGNLDVSITNAVLYDEPIDRIHARASYLAKAIDIPQLEVAAGPSRLQLTAHYDHPDDTLRTGSLQFRLENARVDLAKLRNLQKLRSGLGGSVEIAANGSADVSEAEPRFLLHSLDASVTGRGILADGKKFGDFTLAANTTGNTLNFSLDSKLAEASVQGRGHAQLGGDYPIDTHFTFNNVSWTKLKPLVTSTGGDSSFEVLTDGEITLRGPAMKVDELSGSLRLAKLQVSSLPSSTGAAKPVTLQNKGPVELTVNRQSVRIESAHLTGPDTDIEASGSASLEAQSFDLKVNANANLALLQNFSRDITSSGSAVLTTSVRGTVHEPLVNGRLELHDGSLNYAGFSNGLSKANGTVLFNGNSAAIREMTAESGGGKIVLRGFVTLSGTPRFGLRAAASSVRVRAQGVSIVTDGNINLTGTTEGSAVSGTATITRLTYAPQTDVGSILSGSARPAETAAAPSAILENMRLDVRIRTSDALAVQTSLAENLQASADLRVRGTAATPGVLGRITVTGGQLVFFGSSYTVNSGAIGFYNPVSIDPVLDLSLETQAHGVDVVLRVTGPIDNIRLSYTSEPPLPFDEIIALLAAGKTPTTDPTLLANQPAQPTQGFQQMGESAIIGQALANPVANRLQRVFGVSQLKINPTFATGSQLPQTQVSLQQQIASNLTFTYVTDLDNANAQTIRVEWALNPEWSTVATRDLNGIFSINLLYKRQVR